MNGEKELNKMTQKEFIQQVLINQIGSVNKTDKYLSYILIVSGIELLGICVDENGFFESGHSGKRFRNIIENYFPDSYKIYNNNGEIDLYSELRCGLLHSVLPKQKIGLSEIAHGSKHLSIQDGRLVLVAEDFYNDFKNACEIIIDKIDRGEIKERFKLLHP